MDQLVYSIDAYNRTFKDAVNDFPRNYWAEARKARAIDIDGKFQMVRGTATYQIRHNSKQGFAGIYEIYKLNTEA